MKKVKAVLSVDNMMASVFWGKLDMTWINHLEKLHCADLLDRFDASSLKNVPLDGAKIAISS